jgi:hypothetical protein
VVDPDEEIEEDERINDDQDSYEDVDEEEDEEEEAGSSNVVMCSSTSGKLANEDLEKTSKMPGKEQQAVKSDSECSSNSGDEIVQLKLLRSGNAKHEDNSDGNHDDSEELEEEEDENGEEEDDEEIDMDDDECEFDDDKTSEQVTDLKTLWLLIHRSFRMKSLMNGKFGNHYFHTLMPILDFST